MRIETGQSATALALWRNLRERRRMALAAMADEGHASEAVRAVEPLAPDRPVHREAVPGRALVPVTIEARPVSRGHLPLAYAAPLITQVAASQTPPRRPLPATASRAYGRMAADPRPTSRLRLSA